MAQEMDETRPVFVGRDGGVRFRCGIEEGDDALTVCDNDARTLEEAVKLLLGAYRDCGFRHLWKALARVDF